MMMMMMEVMVVRRRRKRKTKRREEELQAVESLLAVKRHFVSQITMESKCTLVDTKWLPVGAVKMMWDMI